MARYTVSNWNELSDLIMRNRGKKFAMISIFGPRGKEKMEQDNQVVKVEAITLEITE